MAKMQHEEREPIRNPAFAGQKFHVNLTAVALGVALSTRAEIKALRRQLDNANITLDSEEFMALSKMFLAEVIEEFRTYQPDLADAIPSIQSLIDSGILTFDR